MDATEQAIDQTLRITLTGVEYALRLSGSGATHLAGALWSVATTRQKTKGKARLESLLKSGKELKVFNVAQSELKGFAKEAKKFGVLYAVIKGVGTEPGELADIMVKAEDASKINRIVEKLEYGRLSDTTVSVRSQRQLEAGRDAAERGEAQLDANGLLDELLAEDVFQEGMPAKNPIEATAAGPRPSEPSSKSSASRSGRSQAAADAGDVASNAAGKEGRNDRSRTRTGVGFDDGRTRPSVKAQIEEKRQERAERRQDHEQQTKARQTRQQPPKQKRRGSKNRATAEKGR
jgi:hypothetical protein